MYYRLIPNSKRFCFLLLSLSFLLLIIHFLAKPVFAEKMEQPSQVNDPISVPNITRDAKVFLKDLSSVSAVRPTINSYFICLIHSISNHQICLKNLFILIVLIERRTTEKLWLFSSLTCKTKNLLKNSFLDYLFCMTFLNFSSSVFP